MKRTGGGTNANAILVRGNPYPLWGLNYWNTGYLFQYSGDGFYSIWKYVGGSVELIKFWTFSDAINQGDAWNTLKVRANGNQMDFFINDDLVWSGTDDSFSAGKVGISYFAADGVEFQVDYARLTDLSHHLVEKTADRKTAKPGEEITYTITIFNNEPGSMSDIFVEDVFDGDVDIVSSKVYGDVDFLPRLGDAAFDQVSPINSGRKQTWHFDLLNCGNSITIVLVAKTPED